MRNFGFGNVASFIIDRRGNVAIMFALTASSLLTFSGLAIDFGRAQKVREHAQLALDSAVLAGAKAPPAQQIALANAIFKSNAISGSETTTATFEADGDGVISGEADIIVPTYFAKLARIPQFNLKVKARAEIGDSGDFCILALAESGKRGVQSNGASQANLACNIMSNTSARCNGHDLGAPIGYAHGLNDGCGVARKSNVSAVEDPYAELAVNIPSNPCTLFSKIPTKTSDLLLPLGNQWTGLKTLSGNVNVCGDLQLKGNTVVTAPNGAALIIWNGRLDLNGYTLKTASGSGLTIIFAGSNAPGYQHIPTGNGTLDITAPTSGVWKGVAVYQAPTLKTNVDIYEAGNSPALSISGLMYLPHATVTLKGAVNKSSTGASCFALVIDNITVSGTGAIFANNTECAIAGLDRPKVPSSTRLIN